jgi:hypothetical protein
MIWGGGACMTRGRNKNCMKNLFAKREGKRTIERSKRRGYYNIQRYYKNWGPGVA